MCVFVSLPKEDGAESRYKANKGVGVGQRRGECVLGGIPNSLLITGTEGTIKLRASKK